jgi:hypothetical protein
LAGDFCFAGVVIFRFSSVLVRSRPKGLSVHGEDNAEAHFAAVHLSVSFRHTAERIFLDHRVRVSDHQPAVTARPWDFTVPLGEGIRITSFDRYRRRIASYFGSWIARVFRKEDYDENYVHGAS